MIIINTISHAEVSSLFGIIPADGEYFTASYSEEGEVLAAAGVSEDDNSVIIRHILGDDTCAEGALRAMLFRALGSAKQLLCAAPALTVDPGRILHCNFYNGMELKCVFGPCNNR